MATPLFESPPVEKLAKSYTGYYNSGSVNQLGHSVETRHDEHNRQESLDGLRKQQALQLQEENLLCNYLNNIAEFSKFNDIDMFDQCRYGYGLGASPPPGRPRSSRSRAGRSRAVGAQSQPRTNERSL